MRLLFNIDHQHISVTRGQNVVSDSVRYLTAQFGFSEDWDGTAKTAIFSGKGGTYEVLLTNDACTVPYEVISGRFGVSVFGVRNGVRITTDTAYLCVQQSGYTPGETPSEPTPSVYEQIMDKITDEETNRETADDTLSERLTAEETARTAADKAMTDTINGKADKAAVEAETAAREADIAAIKNGTDIDSFADVETALTGKQDVGDYATKMDLAYKQDKLTFDLTPAISQNPVTSNGIRLALAKKADAENTDKGFHGGNGAHAFSGGAIGKDALTANGFAGGEGARTINDYGYPSDAIQLGTGTNSKPKTMQVYDYTMMDADGTIPEERIADLPLAKTDENNNFTTSQTITGTLTVNGDIVQNGASYESHAEQLYTKNDLIKTRDGAVGGLGDGEYTGIEAEKYDGENNGRLVFDANGTARVGDVGSEQPLLTREEASTLKDRQLFVWNATTLKAIGVTLSNGFAIARNTETNEEFLIPWGATESAIDQRTSNSNLITPANLDYAVRSVLPKTADTIPSTLVANTEYYAGELAMVSFALPTTGKLGQYCFVKFDSGATATTLTVTGSYAGDIPTPVANKTYEILATWNGSKWVCSYRGY